MSKKQQATKLKAHTLESFLRELISGRSVITDDKGTIFEIHAPESRAILAWYLDNKEIWPGLNKTEQVEAIVDCIEISPPVFSQITTESPDADRTKIHLKSMLVHRFAGIHQYGSEQQPPDNFYLELDKPLTLIEGLNGAGKTSILSAITWCLTGYIYRSQKPPEKVTPKETEFDIKLIQEQKDNEDEEKSFKVLPIVPLPRGEILEKLDKNRIPIDTWVELTFVDGNENEIAKVKRSFKVTNKGKFIEEEPDLTRLAIDPIALEIGTKMPGLLPYIRVGEKSTLGEAVSELTGFRPLHHLMNHASKSLKKLRSDFPMAIQKEINKLDTNYTSEKTEYLENIDSHQEIAPEISVPPPGVDKSIEGELNKLIIQFDKLQSQCMDCSPILGSDLDSEDKNPRKDMIDSVGPAIGQVSTDNISKLTSAKRLSDLKKISNKELLTAESLIQQILKEARELSNLQQKPNLASRLRLYAKVAGWMKDLPSDRHDLTNCPVCNQVLVGRKDIISEREIADHIKEFLGKDSEYLEKTIKAWEEYTLSKLATELPDALKSEMKKDLPELPYKLIETALIEELFATNSFKGSLAGLKKRAVALCNEKLKSLPKFQEPEVPRMPECFESNGKGLANALRIVTRAIAFSKWRKNADDSCSKAFETIVGKVEVGRRIDIENISDDSPIVECLYALNQVIQSAEPVTTALNRLRKMKELITERREKEEKLEKYERAAKAIDPILKLQSIADQQVSNLINSLSGETKKWKDRLYKPAYDDAPTVERTDATADGALEIRAVSQGVEVPAQHVSNASDLRATLLAFLITFWKHTLESRGGLSLILLDDLQELFDPMNRGRVAGCLPDIVEEGARIIATTNDPEFGRKVSFHGGDKIDRRKIHPLTIDRKVIELGSFTEKIDEKRMLFDKPENKNKPGPAQDYINELRIYIERRLKDFFRNYSLNLQAKPTVSDLLNAIRSRRKSGVEPFSYQAFGRLADDTALKPNSKFIGLMNKSHHSDIDEIGYAEVSETKDTCSHVLDLVDMAYEEYERWLQRDLKIFSPAEFEAPKPITPPKADVPMIMNLAAFTGEYISSGDQIREEFLSREWFKNKAIYHIDTNNLGFAAPLNSKAIVDISDSPIEDARLVIASYKGDIYARRLLRNNRNPGYIALGSETVNPLKRAPSLIIPVEEVKLLKIVGILFDDEPHATRDEAVPLNEYQMIDKIDLAFKVDGDSALPLALEGQTILGGPEILPAQMPDMEGHIVALKTSEGAFLKRVGKALSGAPHVRQFESIGGYGESMIIRTEQIEDDPYSEIPSIESARHVLGVLYDSK